MVARRSRGEPRDSSFHPEQAPQSTDLHRVETSSRGLSPRDCFVPPGRTRNDIYSVFQSSLWKTFSSEDMQVARKGGPSSYALKEGRRAPISCRSSPCPDSQYVPLFQIPGEREVEKLGVEGHQR